MPRYDFHTQLLVDAAERLAEWFPSVQIVASFTMPDGDTMSVRGGSGDWNARVNLCRRFAALADNTDLINQIIPRIRPPEDPPDFSNITVPPSSPIR